MVNAKRVRLLGNASATGDMINAYLQRFERIVESHGPLSFIEASGFLAQL
jgi:hypothetical protein